MLGEAVPRTSAVLEAKNQPPLLSRKSGKTLELLPVAVTVSGIRQVSAERLLVVTPKDRSKI